MSKTDMTAGIRAIETVYAGCRFRSRLEARWAVYFDSLGWSWDYEPEGFELLGGRYLPDFKVHVIPALCPCPRHDELPRHEWFEVKGQEPTEREIALALELSIATGEQVTIVCDIPRPRGMAQIQGWRARRFGQIHPNRFFTHGGGDDDQCNGDVEMAAWLVSVGMNRNSRLLAAATAARSARFEFGESG